MIPLGKTTRRADGPWLRAKPLQRVFDALQAGGAETRVVGGAVRDALLRRAVGEIDLATTAQPEVTMRLATAAGLGAHPTGVDHGTVTLVADGTAFEVTTLRRDVETDGRHAVVNFTQDWAEDAARRDFTINALSSDRDGVVYDFVGGLEDLDAKRVRFIGDAATRIREDYLRILRFFRFSADYVEGALDGNGLAACVTLRHGVSRLSAERIGAEMMKLLWTPRAGEIAAVMQVAGILKLVLGVSGHPDRIIRLQRIETALAETADPLTRLAALALDGPDDAKALAARLRLSNLDAERLAAAAVGDHAISPAGGAPTARASLYRLGPEAYTRAVRVAWVRAEASPNDDAWRKRAELQKRWTAPKLPFAGTDVLALGVEPGPRVGAILSIFEEWWIAQGFPTDTKQLVAKLTALVRRD